MMPDLIETRELSRRFGRTEAVHDLTLSVPEGSVFALVGPNGAGKTTAIKLLMSLLQPSSGTARVLGADARRLPPSVLARIGFVSEGQDLPRWMTVDDLFGYCAPLYPTWDRELARSLARQLDLPPDRRFDACSRGTRMKAALAASMAYRPELLVMDEPFTGLDALVREELSSGLLDTIGDRTVFLSSHDIDEVERLADWIAIIDQGRLVVAEPVAALLARFREVEVSFDRDPALPASPPQAWLLPQLAGRTLRYVDSAFVEADTPALVERHVPGGRVTSVDAMSLRAVFVTLAREFRVAGMRPSQ